MRVFIDSVHIINQQFFSHLSSVSLSRSHSISFAKLLLLLCDKPKYYYLICVGDGERKRKKQEAESFAHGNHVSRMAQTINLIRKTTVVQSEQLDVSVSAVTNEMCAVQRLKLKQRESPFSIPSEEKKNVNK